MVKEHYLLLFEEIKKVCTEANIPFFVSGELANTLSGDFFAEFYHDASIMVFAKDIRKLMHELGNKNNRELESLATNKRFPGFYIRYMDTTTLCLDYMEPNNCYDMNCIGINIEIICNTGIGNFKEELLNKIKKAWVRKTRNEYLIGKTDLNFKNRFKQKLIGVFFFIFGTPGNMRRLFFSWLDCGSPNSKSVDVALNNGTFVRFDRNIFNSVTLVEVDKCVLPFVSKRKEFVNDLNYRKNPTCRIITSNTVCWDKYNALLKCNDVNLKRIRTRYKKNVTWRKTKFAKFRGQRSYYYNLLFCTQDRFIFQNKFNDETKRDILAYYANKEFVNLKNILCDYLGKIKEYQKYNIGLCFDKDIFIIAIHLLIIEAKENSNRKEEYIKKCKKISRIIDCVPVYHFDDLDKSKVGIRQDIDVLNKIKQDVSVFVEKLYDIVWEE